MPGTIVTFYSYKGGVGRSFTLANIAILLARWGYRVLCVDWDLEAPGLHDYFGPLMNTDPTGGVVDLVDDFLTRTPHPADHTNRLAGVGVLDFLAAGRADENYVGRVQDIDWKGLYGNGFAEYLERCRARWTADYDYVLLDSRTGVSDIGSVCTAHLPDRLVVLYTANLQSIRGVVDVARRANVARDKMPYDRAQLAVLPVLSRFDTREEYDRSEEWRRVCLEETKSLYHNWLDRGVSPELMSRHLTLPYVSYWSFGEQLPVRVEQSPGADQIGFALETVAAVVAHHFDRTELLAENRDAYVAAVRSVRREFTYDVRISTPRPKLPRVNDMIKQLTEMGVRADLSLSGDRSLLGRAKDDARHLCLVVDRTVSPWQSAEVELFLRRTFGQDRRLIPVLTADTDPHTLPGYVANLRYLRFTDATRMARDLARQIAGDGTSTGDTDDDLTELLRQAADTTLRPSAWELVADICRALLATDDATQTRELAIDLALSIRPRAAGPEPPVPAPPHVRRLIRQVMEGIVR